MKFYSDKTKALYESEEACRQAEEAFEKQQIQAKLEQARKEREEKERKEKDAAERKAAAAELEEARKEMVKAQNHYAELMNAFIKKYHSYHYTTTSLDEIPTLFSNFFNLL